MYYLNLLIHILIFEKRKGQFPYQSVSDQYFIIMYILINMGRFFFFSEKEKKKEE